MSARHTAVLPSIKQFVRASENHNLNEADPNPAQYHVKHLLSGQEARRAYEKIVEPQTSEKQRIQLKVDEQLVIKSPSHALVKSPCRNVKETPSINTLMKYAEGNNLNKIAEALANKKVILNSVDSFGWTMLMSAACAGSERVVAFLLDAGADVSIRDKAANSCITLAKRNGHLKIARMISKFLHTNSNKRKEERKQSDPVHASVSVYCNVCKENVQQSVYAKHLTSTSHLLGIERESMPTLYGIPTGNKGYQLMVKSGWDREHGLGPSGKGRKMPVKTVLKTDRKGLGTKQQQKARITHFTPGDVSAVANQVKPRKTKTKEHIVQDLKKDKRKTQFLRSELS